MQQREAQIWGNSCQGKQGQIKNKSMFVQSWELSQRENLVVHEKGKPGWSKLEEVGFNVLVDGLALDRSIATSFTATERPCK